MINTHTSLQCLSRLSHLQHLRLDYICFPWAEQQGKAPAFAAALFRCTPYLTSLVLHWDKELILQHELEHISSLAKLCRLDLSGSDAVPITALAHLTGLTSLHVKTPSEDLAKLTGLRQLNFCSNHVFVLLPISFSALSKVTALRAGSCHSTNRSDILSMKILPSLQNLILNGPVKRIEPGEYPGRLRRWEAFSSLTSIKHLELVDVDHTSDMFRHLASMTQLTHLSISSVSTCASHQKMGNGLLHLSRLVSLRYLHCCFPRPHPCKAPTEQYVKVYKDVLKAVKAHSPALSTCLSFRFRCFLSDHPAREH